MLRILIVLISLVGLGGSATAQSQTFTREGLDYALDLPSPSWKAVARLDVHRHVEFMNGENESEGYLRLRKRFVTPGTKPKDIFLKDEMWQLRKLPGYVVCSDAKGEEFSGRLSGAVFSYEYVNAGTNMDGRIYYLQLDNRTFYALHFTVASEKLKGLREQMDYMARSFRKK
jgi:hypothetical protein